MNKGKPAVSFEVAWKSLNRMRHDAKPKFKSAFKVPKGVSAVLVRSKITCYNDVVGFTDSPVLTRSEREYARALTAEWQDWVDDQKKTKEAGENEKV